MYRTNKTTARACTLNGIGSLHNHQAFFFFVYCLVRTNTDSLHTSALVTLYCTELQRHYQYTGRRFFVDGFFSVFGLIICPVTMSFIGVYCSANNRRHLRQSCYFYTKLILVCRLFSKLENFSLFLHYSSILFLVLEAKANFLAELTYSLCITCP